VALGLGGVAGLEAGEALAARVAAHAHAVRVDVGARLARHDPVFLAAVFGAEGHVHAAHHRVVVAAEIGVAGQLLEGEAARVKAAGADTLAAF